MSTGEIACSLRATELKQVEGRYREAARHYIGTVRFDESGADVHLIGSKDPLRSLLDEMIARESECCSFLRFDVRETPDGYEVRLSIVAESELSEPLLREMALVLFPAARVVPE